MQLMDACNKVMGGRKRQCGEDAVRDHQSHLPPDGPTCQDPDAPSTVFPRSYSLNNAEMTSLP